MKVIGAGFGRTGTMSLKAALEQLGLGPCFHMIDLIRDPEPLPYWRPAAGERVDWTEALDGWESSVDWPGCTFWEEMAETWPDAPVLLSVRDPEAWYRTCRTRSTRRRRWRSAASSRAATRRARPRGRRHHQRPDLERHVQGPVPRQGLRDRGLPHHNEDVKARCRRTACSYTRSSRAGGRSASFFGVDVPDTPMPHLNDTESFRNMCGMPALAT